VLADTDTQEIFVYSAQITMTVKREACHILLNSHIDIIRVIQGDFLPGKVTVYTFTKFSDVWFLFHVVKFA
jgi:hypothetical protein